ncbi:hypothetical protein ABIF07_008470 [Bradyrhizobium elkanii]|uniref:hypothetical protein n=1 Tax=Bradyrhizobium elkanii TaxID=29448 RepID=UPI002168F392|nr:hypothetical protein [Bradyrhizobium elkanii]MCS3693576.1 hypothetical protein [Bradyrhizobium elkanii]
MATEREGGAHRLAVHVADDREQGAGPAIDLANEVPLRRDGGPFELDDADIIGSTSARDILDQLR